MSLNKPLSSVATYILAKISSLLHIKTLLSEYENRVLIAGEVSRKFSVVDFSKITNTYGSYTPRY